ncbi:putative lipoprotein [Cystobacter fuscus DSM 2262]|uniref:Lipoprotein n=1 Tax=Cystobacter fuscus (strain ATCC 25194 / DSM 2262 / NBRC 100088 / M29) TaxID=1242864 RepID=S9R2K7_CYSF2|nr:hypothetical protein [Cystobacter fuscus]EPX63133.1 putative lipoprotein [Cystobacter fuscus DSM 2262]
MSRTRLWIAAGGLATALTACPARTPAPPPTVPSNQVPPGCERNQMGEYQHADNPSFRYQGADDGSTLTLSVTRAQQEAPAPADAGTAVSIVLERTPEGFVGETRATVFTAAGTACPVSFPTRVVGCDDQGLTLRSVSAMALDEDCRPAAHGTQPEWKEQRLLKREAPAQPAPDAGTPSGDAGD